MAGFDFSSLGAGQPADALIDPRVLFDALPARRDKFEFLRDPQGQVLAAWYPRRDEADLVIKLNTGGGKTVVGLLICQSSLNEGLGPALYIAPDKYLAAQALQQARDDLGMSVTDDPKSSEFRSGEAICVLYIDRFFNGRSVFGVQGGAKPSVDVGTIVFDDAHAALAAIEEKFTIVVREYLPQYETLLNLFADDLKAQSQKSLLDLRTRDYNATAKVPFWSWNKHLDTVAAELHSLRDEDKIQWTWPLVSEVLPVCQAVFTSQGLEIRPPCPPVEMVPSLRAARRRVYLTATLADDSVLVTHFGADPNTVAQPIIPQGAGYLGDRLIMSPQEITPSIIDDDIRQTVLGFSRNVNVVVIVPSFRKAQLWSKYAQGIASKAEDIAAMVEDLRRDHVGLVVLVNKYDGIDLPDEACRILVLDGLPMATTGIARRESIVLGQSDALVGRQLQRIEQGMGRGVRSSKDHCVVVLMGSDLSEMLASPKNRARLGPATRAQVELSRQVTNGLRGTTMENISTVISQVLGRDPAWVATARARLANVEFPAGVVSPVSVHMREAFEHASVQQYEAAARSMSDAMNASTDERQKGVLQEQLAAYQSLFDSAKAQTTLAAAVKRNSAVLKPIQGVAYTKLPSGAYQAAEAAKYLGATYDDPTRLLLATRSLADDLAFDPDRTEEFEEAMRTLALHLGIPASRPDHEINDGPDVLWSVDAGKYLVIEAKSGSNADSVARRDVAQLAHSMNWFNANYANASAVPVLVHLRAHTAENATPPADARSLQPAGAGGWVANIQKMMTALAAGRSWSETDAVGQQLAANNLLAPKWVSSYTNSLL